MHSETPIHPALTHKVLNAYDPDTRPIKFPDGSAAGVVLLGEPCSPEASPDDWWSSDISSKIKSKTKMRFIREGHVLVTLTAVCLSILDTIYTTTWTPGSDAHRIRLQYKSSPIADFGIVSGTTDVKIQDKLAYWNLTDEVFWKGQDPDDHYWLYFTTIRGEDIFLDSSMYTFNMRLMVDGKPYTAANPVLPTMDWVPSFFVDREISRAAPNLQTERKRLSFLRNTKFHQALATDDFALTHDIMKDFAGEPFTEIEKTLLHAYASHSYSGLEIALRKGSWRTWPSQPGMAIDHPDQEDTYGSPSSDDDDAFKLLKKWNKKYRHGQVSREAFLEAYRKRIAPMRSKT